MKKLIICLIILFTVPHVIALECGEILDHPVNLTQDLDGCGEAGLVFITGGSLQCNGHAIQGVDAGASVAIRVIGNDVSIQNCEVAGFKLGILAQGSHDLFVDQFSMEGGEAGIFLNKAVQGSLQHLNLQDMKDGIYLFQSQDITIEDAQIKASEHGLNLEGSSTIGVSALTSDSAFIGVSSEDSTNVIMDELTLVDNRFCIRSTDDIDLTVGTSDISHCSIGVQVRRSTGTVIDANHIHANDRGISVESADSTFIQHNLIEQNNNFGIELSGEPTLTLIDNNTLVQSGNANLLLGKSDLTVVSENTIKDSPYGVFSQRSSRQILMNNVITNHRNGIWLDVDGRIIIMNNFFLGNQEDIGGRKAIGLVFNNYILSAIPIGKSPESLLFFLNTFSERLTTLLA
ncbi:MAG: NosD domain-containing protein [Nanoarchaeota archaeon]